MHFVLITLAAILSNVVAGIPLSTFDSHSAHLVQKRAVTCPGTGQKQFQPTLRTINDPNTDPKMFHVANETVTVSQVATFSDIPATASNFVLWWAQSASPPDFRAVGPATVTVYALDSTKLPADGTLTPEIVDAAIDPTVGISDLGGRVGGAAFGGWPAVKTAQEHLVGGLNADNRAEFSFRFTLRDSGEVWLQQDEQNGWFLHYDC